MVVLWILGMISLHSISDVGSTVTILEQRKHIRSIQAKDIWPKFIYQSVSFNRNPSVYQTVYSNGIEIGFVR